MRKNTLLIAAHGGTPQWNKLVESLAVNAAGLNDDNFDIVFSFLEKKPLISDSVIALDKKGSRNILCLPLFITDSKHLINDIPYELGLIYSGCKDMPPQFRLGANVTLGPHFGLSNEIKDIFLDRVKELSTDPDYEALIILMHGSARYSYSWNETASSLGGHVIKHTGLKEYKPAFLKTSAFGPERLYKLFNSFGKDIRRIICVSAYMGRSAKELIGGEIPYIEELSMFSYGDFPEVVLSEKALLPDDRAAYWLINRAKEFFG